MHGRRIVAVLIVGLGVFLLVLAPMLRWFVLPRVQVAPYDMDFTDVSSGPGSYLDPTTGKVTTDTLTVTRHLLGDAEAGRQAGKAVWDVSTRLDTSRTVHLADARQALNLSTHRWVFDRHTTASSDCCGGDTAIGAEAYLKYPFNTGRRAYLVWDATAGKSFPAEFTGTRRLYGQTFNEYTLKVDPPVRVGTMRVPPSVVGLPAGKDLVTVEEYYSNPASVNLVDSRTGAPVAGSSHQIITLRLPGSDKVAATVLDVQLHSTPQTEKALVDKFRTKHDGLAMLAGPLPVGTLVLGVLCTVGGFLLLLRGRAARSRAEKSADPAGRDGNGGPGGPDGRGGPDSPGGPGGPHPVAGAAR
ncbi:DUF3068 domain-containing protein [Streptomyces sp. H10-C2]|uniref:DUF3068 domain-containing protein n=1 Tax=unclassified Streptomyces TaxID=2593676 RepID=UPI0024B9779B|nr:MULTISPECIES: DUF3068 domain-containing protein [unclassified Streptomyces]MDJ0347199.1 DUF3068 domain-containing protein [Streptomyces sp. PH10-H1]MDJ0370328.1 DUF3068 domain-containing protein [Streptomyces sp. H10-C2]